MNTPTKLTLSRIIGIVILITVLFSLSLAKVNSFTIFNGKVDGIFFIVFIFYLLCCFTDFLDGYLARKNNQITDLGKFLDPIADKMLINSLMIFLTAPSIFAPYANVQTISVPVWCVIILVIRDIIVDAVRLMGAKKNIVIAANKFGKAKTVLEMITISLVLLNNWPFALFDSKGIITLVFAILTTIVSVLSGVIYLVKNKSVFKEEN